MERTEPFVETLRSRGLQAEPFAGMDGFKSLARMLQRARAVVSVNTGVMHLAAIVGAPTVSLNGPTNGARWGPVGPRALGVEAPGEGCGYLHLGFDFDGHGTDCMERITVDLVVAAVETSYGDAGRGALMENMRQVLRSSVGRSLRTLPEFDRLSAAWPVAAGAAMAQRAVPLSFEGRVCCCWKWRIQRGWNSCARCSRCWNESWLGSQR